MAAIYTTFRGDIERTFQPLLGATIRACSRGRDHWAEIQALYRPLIERDPTIPLPTPDEGNTEVENYGVHLETTAGDFDFDNLLAPAFESFVQASEVVAGQRIIRLVVGRNYQHNPLGTYVAVTLYLADGTLLALDGWAGANPENLTYKGRQLSADFAHQGERIIPAGDNAGFSETELLDEASQIITAELGKGRDSPIIIE
jgi:hypothetical protein